MKKAVAFVLFIIVFILCGCSNGSLGKSESEKIIGHWVISNDSEYEELSAYRYREELPIENIFFYEDGQCSYNGFKGTYTIYNGELSVSIFNRSTQTMEIEFVGDEMVLTAHHLEYYDKEFHDTTAYYTKID